MNLSKEQKRIVSSKVLNISLVKGKANTGKTTIAVHRAIYLKNSYCLYDNDNILMLAKDIEHKNVLKNVYEKAEKEDFNEYMTLFSNDKKRVEICTLEELIYKYLKLNELNMKILHDMGLKYSVLNECISELRKDNKGIKILDEKYIPFIIDEIRWIKCNDLRLIEDYQNAVRTGRKGKNGEKTIRLIKNSNLRDIIYKLMNLYDEKLNKKGYIDAEDVVKFAKLKIKNELKYTHIIMDECQGINKSRLNFVKSLLNSNPYASLMLVVNRDGEASEDSCVLKNGKVSSKIFGSKIKSYSLLKVVNNEEMIKEEKGMNKFMTNNSFIENYEYVDLRHDRQFGFSKDLSNPSEIYVNEDDKVDTYTHNELTELPVYSDIAAGEPILMHEEYEANFNLPNLWIKGLKNCFILKVKGSSMIGANIHDEDLVVIRKQSTAQNHDIVAVDLEGSATLKRLSISKEGVVLMPENERYSPIPIQDRQAAILGIAVGVIKHKQ